MEKKESEEKENPGQPLDSKKKPNPVFYEAAQVG